MQLVHHALVAREGEADQSGHQVHAEITDVADANGVECGQGVNGISQCMYTCMYLFIKQYVGHAESALGLISCPPGPWFSDELASASLQLMY